MATSTTKTTPSKATLKKRLERRKAAGKGTKRIEKKLGTSSSGSGSTTTKKELTERQKLRARMKKREAAGKGTSSVKKKLSAAKEAEGGGGIGKVGTSKHMGAGRLENRLKRRTEQGKGTKRITRTISDRKKLSDKKAAGKDTTKLEARMKTRHKKNKTMQKARKAARSGTK